jgi:hypothetical protein
MAAALFVIYAASVVMSALPPRVLDPIWQLRLTASLVDDAPTALLGLGLVHLHAFLDPEDEAIQRYRDRVARFAVAAALGFVLLVPLQLVVSLQVLQNGIADARRAAIIKADDAKFRQEIMAATSTQDLKARLQRLQVLRSPLLGLADLSTPLEPLRQRLLARLDSGLAEALSRAASTAPPSRWSLITSGARNLLASLALAAGFAAGARGRTAQQPLLDEFRGLFKRGSSPGLRYGRPPGRSKVVDEDYFSALIDADAERDDPERRR